MYMYMYMYMYSHELILLLWAAKTHPDEFGQRSQSRSLCQEQGDGTTAKLHVEPQLEPDAVHLGYGRSEVGRTATTHQLNLLAQGSHRYQDTE